MGRMDGEEYDYQRPCRWGNHDWAMNGTCWRCRHDRDALIAQARGVVAEVGMGDVAEGDRR